MNGKPYYPTLTDAQLVPFRALEAQLGQFPDLLDRQDCPYPPHIRTLVRRLIGEHVGPVVDEAMGDDDLVQETINLYREIQRASTNVNTSDPKDKMAIFKTSADLLTKLVALREKAVNIRQMSQFQKAVVEVLESVLEPAQRSDFVEKIGNYTNVQ